MQLQSFIGDVVVAVVAMYDDGDYDGDEDDGGDGDDDGDDVDVDDVDKDYIGDQGAIHQYVSETVRILFQSTWLG